MPLYGITGFSGQYKAVGHSIVAENPNAVAAMLNVVLELCCGEYLDQEAATVPPGSFGGFAVNDNTAFVASSTVPVRALQTALAPAPLAVQEPPHINKANRAHK